MTKGFGRAAFEFWQLLLFRVRSITREPTALFWLLFAPVVLSVVLGLAFDHRQWDDIHIAVADGKGADALSERLHRMPGIRAERTSLADGELKLRRGHVALVLVPGPTPKLLFDPTREDCRVARLTALDALEREAGVPPGPKVEEATLTAPGTRYVDFVIPGLLAYTLMINGLHAVGLSLVAMRSQRLIRRLAATQMNRGAFFASFVVGRALIALVEIAVVTFAAWAFFGVPISGSTFGYVAFATFGATMFGLVGLALASRASDPQAVGGIVNFAGLAMTLLSGVFFSANRFPGWAQPLVQLAPLTSLVSGMRAISLDGAGWSTVWPQVLVLTLWGGVASVVTAKAFRWDR